MKKKLKKLLCILLLTTIVACTSKINKINFDQIKTGMTFSEVISILGKPSNSATLSVGNTTGTSAQWENRNGTISIEFFNNRVKVKRFIEGVSTSRKEW